MGRRRKSDHHLPQRVYHHHGRHWFVDRTGAWHDLGVRWDKEAKQRWSVLSENPETYGSLGWWLDAFMEHRKALVAKKDGSLSQNTYDGNLDEVVYLKAGLGKNDPAAVVPADIREYLDHRSLKGAPVRGNRERALLSACYTWLMTRRDSGVTANPCRGVKRNPEKRRERIIEDWEHAKVRDRARAGKRGQAVYLAMELIYKTAQRPEDLMVAGPRNIRTIDHQSRETRVLRIRQQKTGAHVDIVITPDLDALLRECMGPVPNLDRPFIAGTRGKQKGKPMTYDGLSAMFRRHVKAVGLKDFGLYDLRGKAATDLYRRGESKERIQELLGHDSVTTTEIYLKARMPVVAMPNDRQLRTAEPGK